MSYAQLIKLEEQTDYYGALYDQHKTDQYVKSDTKISKFVNDPVVGAAPRAVALNSGTYASPTLLTLASSSSIPNSSLAKIGAIAATIINPAPAPAPLLGLSTLQLAGTIFSATPANGRIIASGAQPGTIVRIGMNVEVLLTNPIVSTELMFKVVHFMPQSATQEDLCQENISVSVGTWIRSATGTAQTKIESNQDYFIIYFSSTIGGVYALPGITMTATIPV